MKKALTCIAVVVALILCACASTTTKSTPAHHEIAHRYASASEGKDLLLANDKYHAGFSQNDIDFRMQRTGATMEEYMAFAGEQARDFTDEEKALIDSYLQAMTASLDEHGYTLPPLDEVTFVKTTMAEEGGAGGYTHGTTVFVSEVALDVLTSIGNASPGQDSMMLFLWHEIFHCLTRCNPEFRADMYKLVHFTVHDADYVLPPSVMEYHISNPDVEHHDSSATFRIDGKDVECFTDWVTTRHFQKQGDTFFTCGATALVPVDGTDTYYTPDQTANFDEIFGLNTEYVADPEECMADNFSFALTYGTAGQDGNGYKSPEIIEGILAHLTHE